MIEGAPELLKTFDNMTRAMQGRVIRRAVNRSLTPLQRSLRRNAPRGTKAHRTYKGRLVAPGFLSKNIKKSTRLGRNKDIVFASIRAADEAFYGQFGEFGFDAGPTKVAPKPWFFPTVEREADKVLDDFVKAIDREIVKEWLK